MGENRQRRERDCTEHAGEMDLLRKLELQKRTVGERPADTQRRLTRRDDPDVSAEQQSEWR